MAPRAPSELAGRVFVGPCAQQTPSHFRRCTPPRAAGPENVKPAVMLLDAPLVRPSKSAHASGTPNTRPCQIHFRTIAQENIVHMNTLNQPSTIIVDWSSLLFRVETLKPSLVPIWQLLGVLVLEGGPVEGSVCSMIYHEQICRGTDQSGCNNSQNPMSPGSQTLSFQSLPIIAYAGALC